jgi:phosphatidylglycerol---prolipoprotein diacylglyceryl transferase
MSGSGGTAPLEQQYAPGRDTVAQPCRTIRAMLMHPHIDPVAFRLGPLAVHWYGITYLAAFALFLLLALRRLRHEPFASVQGPGAWSRKDIEDMLFLGVMGVVIGGRLGYCLFYKPAYYLAHPLEILYVWQGGMSFHGGMLGVIVSQWWFARSRSKPFWQLMDLIAPCVPLGLAAGRVGNFINGELWGRAADPSLPWAMVFPQSGSAIARHPSQVYQFLLEGVLLFVVLWLYARKPRREGQVAAAFLIGYGILRFIAEYFREPDSHLGLLSLGLTMGQWLCIPMVAAGLLLWVWFGRRPAAVPAR